MEAAALRDRQELTQRPTHQAARRSLMDTIWLESFLAARQMNITLPPTHADLVQMENLETVQQQRLVPTKYQLTGLALAIQQDIRTRTTT